MLRPALMGRVHVVSSYRLYPPLAFPIILLFLVAMVLFTFMLPLIAVVAFRSVGIPSWAGLMILWFSLLGSFINIPVKEVRTGRVIQEWKIVTFFGIPYYVPQVKEEKMVIAVNVGGAVVPTLLSTYMLTRMIVFGHSILLLKAFLAVIMVSIITNKFSKIIDGVGIAVPAFIPPLASAATALLLAWEDPGSVAYVSGTLGTLIGADLMNLPRIRYVKAPVVSIGGAGTFDGIFVSGILSLILVALLR